MSLKAKVKTTSAENSRSAADQHHLLDDLRERLQEKIPASEIIALMYSNAPQAKNEIRSVCKLIFKEEKWSLVSSGEKDRLVDELINSVFGLGPLEKLLADEDITEIMINGTKTMFFEKGGCLFQAENNFTSDDQVRSLIDRILGPLGRRVDESSPMVDARLSQGHRVNAIIHPLSLDGSILTIRKFGESVISIEKLVREGAMDREVAQLLIWGVVSKKNIAVTGGTGSGKTTILNALSCVIPLAERIITIEDSAELKFTEHPHVVRLESRPQNAEGKGKVTIRDLVSNALRMRPDRIVVGECRGGEALDMLQAMNTGHDGSLTTLHANSPHDAVLRLTTLVRYAIELPVDVIESQIASALDLIVHTARDVDGKRYISELATFVPESNPRSCRACTYYRRETGASPGVWFDQPEWVNGLIGQGIAEECEVRGWEQIVSLPL